MVKIAFLFPGQGAQYVGMGKDLFEKYEVARQVFAQAEKILNVDLARVCFEGPQEELTKTSICQPAIFTMSYACYEVLKVECPHIIPSAVAGLSLGEFTALTVAGGLSFEDGLKLVQARGQFMEAAATENKGTMASILGLNESSVAEVCKSVAQKHVVSIANINCPSQIVVSGTREGVQDVIKEAKEKGAKRAIELQVSGAFHSSLMEPARLRLEIFFSNIEIKPVSLAFISNVVGRIVSEPSQIRQFLIDQVTHSVLWEKGIRMLVQEGFDSFVEVGCGKVLSGLQRKIAPETRILNVEDVQSLEALKGGENVITG